jgi:hypothetical protein
MFMIVSLMFEVCGWCTNHTMILQAAGLIKTPDVKLLVAPIGMCGHMVNL